MKIVKLTSLLAGLIALTVVASPLAANACSEAKKDKTQESQTSIPTETSVTPEVTSFEF